MCQNLCSRLLNICHSARHYMQTNCKFWFCFADASPKEDDDQDEDQLLRFWVPQRSFSTQSVQSLTPSLRYMKRDSVTSASTMADDDSVIIAKQRRHSEISRAFVPRSHEWPDRNNSLKNPRFLLERTNSVESIRVSLYKTPLKKTNSDTNSIAEEAIPDDAKILSFASNDTDSTTSTTPVESAKNDGATSSNTDSAEDENLVFGMLSFSTHYDDSKKRLTVHLDRASDFPHRGRKRGYDTMIKLSLLSKQYNFGARKNSIAKELPQCSRKIKNSLSPHFHEDFHFSVEKWKLLKNITLKLSLHDCERQGRHDAIGHILLPLNCVTCAGETIKHHLYFKSQSSPDYTQNGPQLLVSLSYNSTADRLTVGILKCRNLCLKNSLTFKTLLTGANTKLETYAKVTLMCASVKIKSMRTKIVTADCDCDPVYNQTFSFVAPLGFIDEISVVMSVCVRGKLKQDSVIGRVVEGPIAFASYDKLTHWGRMIFGEERVVTEWRNLYQ